MTEVLLLLQVVLCWSCKYQHRARRLDHERSQSLWLCSIFSSSLSKFV